MSPIVLHNPLEISWYKNLLDLTFLLCLGLAIGYSARQYRRGRVVYAVLLVTAFFYGMLLELSGMVLHHSYTQGTFAVMLNFRMVPGLQDATLMPGYVPIFYPVFLFLGYKIVESLDIPSLWQRALTGGLVMACVDAPYIIQGGLPQIGWWTWHQWKMYQLWLGWPLADLWWQMTWDALFFYVLWRAVPHLDARRSNTVTLLGFPLAAAVGINLVAPLLHIPLILVTYLGTPQWPLVVALVLGYVIVAVRAMRLSPADFVEPVTVIVAGIYVLSMAVMVIGNALYEKGLTEYIAVQSAALIILCGFVAYPALRGRSRRVPATDAESHTSRSDRAADPMDTR
ncbi:hypothetical protein JMUB5695_01808 [Mycobacterium heckeshornense]|nr:hypothetical protein JMUB5695_01808 [Mycobacterium heckeshornense]